MDTVSKEFIVLGDFNKNLEWLNSTMSLGFSQVVSQPTRETQTSSTLIGHIFTNREKYINHVSVSKISIGNHYAIFGNRKRNFSIGKHCPQTISYRPFKHFDKHAFIQDLSLVPWEAIRLFNYVDEIVENWNSVFSKVVN